MQTKDQRVLAFWVSSFSFTLVTFSSLIAILVSSIIGHSMKELSLYKGLIVCIIMRNDEEYSQFYLYA